MAENKYDDPVFFEKYGQMARSRDGLAGAGEWESLRRLLPDFRGRRALDLGCGYGWHCAWAAEQGAASVLGIDGSARMLEEAARRNARPGVSYRRMALEDAGFPQESFDIVMSSLTFHYIRDIESLFRRIHAWLAPGGDFVFSAEHPVFTAEGGQDWRYREDGSIDCFPVDRYFLEGERTTRFLGEAVEKRHRTLTTWLAAVLRPGFELLDFVEPMPPARMLEAVDGMRDELRRPMMFIVKARKRL